MLLLSKCLFVQCFDYMPVSLTSSTYVCWEREESVFFWNKVCHRRCSILEIKILLASSSEKCIYPFLFCFQGEFVSMGVISDGNSYGVPEDLLYSFPVVIKVTRLYLSLSISCKDLVKLSDKLVSSSAFSTQLLVRGGFSSLSHMGPLFTIL